MTSAPSSPQVDGPRRRGRPTRRSGVADLSRDEITQAALDIARTSGLAGITVRLVATRLHVSPMAMYQHFADKSAIVDAVVNAAMGEIQQPPRDRDTPWTEWLIAQALEAIRVFRAYPGLTAFALDRGAYGVGDASLRIADGILEVLLDVGFSETDALRIYLTCFSFVTGQMHTHNDSPSLGDGPAETGRFPSLRRVAVAYGPETTSDAVLEYGLRRLIAGIVATDGPSVV